jgi:hypothetical protein
MDFKKKFSMDTEAEIKGRWVKLDESTELLIARNNNTRYKELFNIKIQPYRQSIGTGMLPEETAQKVMIEIMADAILLDWKGVEDEGQPITYSKEAAVQLLTKYKEFRDFVSAAADNATLYKLSEQEVAVKN